MSHENVERVITRLMSEEELRIRFAFDPFDAIADLHDQGFLLTPDEIDLFLQSKMEIWCGEHAYTECGAN